MKSSRQGLEGRTEGDWRDGEEPEWNDHARKDLKSVGEGELRLVSSNSPDAEKNDTAAESSPAAPTLCGQG